MPEATLGIDLSAQREKTWACTVAWAPGGGIESITFHPRQSDAELLDLMGRDIAVGIDAPFGWPRDYVEALRAYCDSGMWPGGLSVAADATWSSRYRLRTTDERVAATTPARPLSVSADNLAVVAFRAAGLLTAAATSRGFDRTGHGTAIYEVYPAGALAVWGLPHKGYKIGGSAEQNRRVIVAQLRGRVGLNVVDETWRAASEAMIAGDHALDAFISALVARLASSGQTEAPNASDAEAAAVEGWIHLPTRGDSGGAVWTGAHGA
jgi:hypothetical protein